MINVESKIEQKERLIKWRKINRQVDYDHDQKKYLQTSSW